MVVTRVRISVNALSRFGSRCGTTTYAIPRSGESALSKAMIDSSPPAEAPTPTTGKVPRALGFPDAASLP
jgi:hypothetical protein